MGITFEGRGLPRARKSKAYFTSLGVLKTLVAKTRVKVTATAPMLRGSIVADIAAPRSLAARAALVDRLIEAGKQLGVKIYMLDVGAAVRVGALPAKILLPTRKMKARVLVAIISPARARTLAKFTSRLWLQHEMLAAIEGVM